PEEGRCPEVGKLTCQSIDFDLDMDVIEGPRYPVAEEPFLHGAVASGVPAGEIRRQRAGVIAHSDLYDVIGDGQVIHLEVLVRQSHDGSPDLRDSGIGAQSASVLGADALMVIGGDEDGSGIVGGSTGKPELLVVLGGTRLAAHRHVAEFRVGNE